MASRADQTKPLLSSLVVRPPETAAVDYEAGEVRPDAPSRPRSDRYSDDHRGYRTRVESGSPTRHRDADRRHSTGSPTRHRDMRQDRGFRGGRAPVRSPGRYRAYSPPPFTQDRGTGRPFGKPLSDPGFGSGRHRGESRNNPNIRPREGDWYCPDPACRNLNFARREYCYSCNRHRHPPTRSPRRGYGRPPSPAPPPRRFPGPPPMDRLPGRFTDDYRSLPPPRFPLRDVGFSGPLDHPHHYRPSPRDRFDHHLDDEFRDRAMFLRPPPPEWPPMRGYERRPLSPLRFQQEQWIDNRDVRERTQSPPFRGNVCLDRRRDDRHGPNRDRIGSVY